MSRRSLLAGLAPLLACLAVTVSPHEADAQVGPSASTDDRAGPEPRSPAVAGLGLVLTLAGVPLVVGGTTLLADGLARDERRELEAIDDLETSGGVLLLGGGAILVGAGIPTIVWGMTTEESEPAPRPAPVVAVGGRGASATWIF